MKEKGRRLVVVNTNPRKNVSDTASGTATRRSVAGGGSGANIGGTEAGDLAEMSEMFELRKTSTPWLIFVKRMFNEFTVKNPITLLSGLIFKKDDLSKPITDIKRSTDGDNEFLLDEDGNAVLDEEGGQVPDPLYVPIDDATLPTTRYAEDRFLNKTKDDRSKGKISSDVGFEVGEFVSGASGATLYKDKTSGQTVGELDKLYVRMKAYFETLEIVNVNSVGGKQILSPGGSVKCIGVEEQADAYRCYFLGEQDGEETENRWEVNDQAYSQMFNAKPGVSNKISNTYYWRLVTGVSEDVTIYQEKKCHYIDLSKTDADTGSDVPKAGDVINQRGNRSDIDRMNFIEQSSVSSYSPNITLFHGVNSYSLDGKAYVDFGVDKSTNKAYMNVYGDMYVGDREGTDYMRYTQDGGLEIRGKFVTKSGKDLEELIEAASPEGYKNFVDKVTQELEGLQQQIDGVIESYFYQYDPTSENYPASEWEAVKDKAEHLNDTFTNIASGNSWRWVTDGSGNYYWKEIEDTATVKALAAAGKAQDTADGKRRVFVSEPKPPYDLGDLWAGGTDAYLMVCVKEKGELESFETSDWGFADNSSKLNKELSDLVQTTKDDLNNAIGQAKDASANYTDEARAALQTSIDEMNKAKANVSDVYNKAQADGKISDAEKAAIDAAGKQADAAIALSETLVKAYADGVVDAEEAARIKQAEENLAEAKKYAEEKANEAYKNALTQIGTFDYLKAALKEDTTVQGGLIQSSLIKLGYTNDSGAHVTMSGSNGIYDKQSHGGGIASWWGGEMKDILDYYTWNGTDWVLKDGLSAPTNLPAGLIRFDGTGFLAGGKFWWNKEGEIHADPTALLLSFDVSTDNETLAATIINLRKEIAQLSGLWSRKKDERGRDYMYTSLPIVTQSGVTMYSNTEALDLPGVYDGLPIDGSTLYWENGVLKSKVGTAGGGTADSVAWENVTGRPLTLASPYALTISDSGGAAKVTYDGSSAQELTLTKAMVGLGNVENVAVDGFIAALQGEIDGLWNRNSFDDLTAGHLAADTIAADVFYGTWNGEKITNDYLDKNSINVNGTTVNLGSSFNTAYITSGTAGTSGDTNGYTLSVPYVTISQYGIVTGYGTHTHTINSIPNSSLANSSVSISGQSVSLGGSITQATLRTALGLGSNAYTSTSYLPSASYTAADVLAKLLTVDGAGSGLDADTLDGAQPSALNVGSATKLQTARTIWGQSFDGTGNVSGALTGVTNITASGAITASSVSATTLYQNGTALDTIIDGFVTALQGGIDALWDRNSFDDLYAEHVMSDTIATESIFSDAINTTTLSASSTATFNGAVNITDTNALTFSSYGGGINMTDSTWIRFTGSKSVYHPSGTFRTDGYLVTNGGITVGATAANNGTYKLHVTGSGYISSNLLTGGGITMYSSRKLKDIVDERGLSLEELALIKPTRFTWKDKRDDRTHIGGIAEDIQMVLPEVIYRTSDDILTMDYGNAAFAIASSLIKPVIDHEERIAVLERENKSLKEEIKRLKNR